MSRKPRPLATAHEALRAALRDMGLTDQARRLAVAAVWEQAVGHDIAARTEPFGFSRGVLSVRVGSAAWQQELSLLAPSLVARLNHELGGPVVKELRLLGGRVQRRQTEPRPSWLDAQALPDDERAVESTAAPIVDPEVRDAFARLMLLERKKNRARGQGAK